nr:6-phosphogluconolactonase [Nocardioides perillae]
MPGADPGDASAHLRVLPDAETLATTVATDLLVRLAAAQGRGDLPHVVLTGGTIADAVHRELARLGPASAVDWSRVEVWWGDERFVEAASGERNERQAREAVLDHLPLDPARVHPVPAVDAVADVAAAAAAYAEELAARGPGSADGPDAFEVVMLGLGPDAHVASLFPGFAQVRVDDEGAVPVTDSPKPPPERVSMTAPTLARTRGAWFLVSGEGKAQAVADTLAADPTDPGAADVTPAVRLAGVPERRWYVDTEAASRLPAT